MPRAVSPQQKSTKLFAGLMLHNRHAFNQLQRQFRADLLDAMARVRGDTDTPWSALQYVQMQRELKYLLDVYYGRYPGDTAALFYQFAAEEGNRGWRTAFTEQLKILGIREATD